MFMMVMFVMMMFVCHTEKLLLLCFRGQRYDNFPATLLQSELMPVGTSEAVVLEPMVFLFQFCAGAMKIDTNLVLSEV